MRKGCKKQSQMEVENPEQLEEMEGVEKYFTQDFNFEVVQYFEC